MAGKEKLIKGAVGALTNLVEDLPTRRDFLKGLGALGGVTAFGGAHILPKVIGEVATDVAPVAVKAAAKVPVGLSSLPAWKSIEKQIKDASVEMQATNEANSAVISRTGLQPEAVEIPQHLLKSSRKRISEYIDAPAPEIGYEVEIPEGVLSKADIEKLAEMQGVPSKEILDLRKAGIAKKLDMNVWHDINQEYQRNMDKVMGDIWFHYASNGKFNVSGKEGVNKVGHQIFSRHNKNINPEVTDMGDGSGYVEYTNPWDWQYNTSYSSLFDRFEKMRTTSGLSNKQLAKLIEDSGYGPKDNSFATRETYSHYFDNYPGGFAQKEILKDRDAFGIPGAFKIDFPE